MKFQLNKYKKIIFDLDGVLTSEEAYWQAAALTVYDLLISHEYYGMCGIDREWCRKQYKEIYYNIFCGGRTIRAVKNLGVNSSWDLAYVVFCVSKYINPELTTLDAAHFHSVCMFIENIDSKPPELFDILSGLAELSDAKYQKGQFSHNGVFFKETVTERLITWFSGCDEFDGLTTNSGFLFSDKKLDNLFKELNKRGIELGIGSGRSTVEIVPLFEKHNFQRYFNDKLYCSIDEVNNAEKALKLSESLTKPNPFVFVKAAIGSEYSDDDIISGKYSKDDLKDTLIVGDAMSDLFAAKEAGFDFLGVLTGIDPETTEQLFKEHKADYILPAVLDIIK